MTENIIIESILNYIDTIKEVMPTGLFSTTLVVISVFLTSYISGRKLKVAHDVAIIGFPKSGKTTLITSLFAEIFSRRIQNFELTPIGDETITKVNTDIARLENGEMLSPTTEKDLFSYRVELKAGSTFFPKKYKIAIGDFPGEDSENFSLDSTSWLHETPFFRWVANADAFIFIIDSSGVFKGQDIKYFVANINKHFRAAWQKLKDHHYSGASKLKKKSITIVFTKTDLIAERYTGDQSRYGMDIRDDLPITKSQKEIENYFRDLICYFQSEVVRCNIIHSSSFAHLKSKKSKIGMQRLISSFLPR